MNHSVKAGNRAIGISNKREVQGVSLGLGDVADPGMVVFDRIDREADHLDVAAVELRLEPGDGAEFGRANRGEVLRVTEQNRPRGAHPLVEAEEPFSGLSFEIRGRVAKLEHGRRFLFGFGGTLRCAKWVPGLRRPRRSPRWCL